MLKLADVNEGIYTIVDSESGLVSEMTLIEFAWRIAKGVVVEGCERTRNGLNITLGGDTTFVRVKGLGTAIRQYTVSGQLIKEYISFSEAGRVLKCSPSWIAHCCRIDHGVKTCKGFIWRRVCCDEIAAGDLSNLPNPKPVKLVRQYTLRGQLVAEYKHCKQASKSTSISRSMISECCRRLPGHNTAGGYVWRFSDDDDIAESGRVVFANRKPVRQYTKDGKFVKEYLGSRDAEVQTGIQSSNISACCSRKPRHNSAGGFIWRFATDDEFAAKE